QAPTVVSRRFAPITSVRDDRLKTSCFDFIPQWVGVVAFVRDDGCACRHLDRDVLQGWHQQVVLAYVGTRRRHPQRQPVGFNDDFEFHTFTNLSFADVRAPFFARINVASARSSSRSSRPNSPSSMIKIAWICWRTSPLAHSCSLRQQVLPEGRSTGM